jgi:uncharacterized protein
MAAIYDCHIHVSEPIELILEEMDRNGVAKGLVCPSGIARGELVESLSSAKAMMDRISRSRAADSETGFALVRQWNRKTAALIAPHVERVRGFAKVDLRLTEKQIASVMQEALELDFIGFGEILGAEVWPERFAYLLACSQDLGGYPIFVHADYPMTSETLALLVEGAKKHPLVPLIIGHLGGDFWIEAIEWAMPVKNIYLDISEAVNLVAVRTAAAEVPDRLLYGSDFPWETEAVGLQRIDALKLPQSRKDDILGKNLERLLDTLPINLSSLQSGAGAAGKEL